MRLLFSSIFLIILGLNYSYGYPRHILRDDEDADLTVPQLITKYGYPCEEHFVTTDDGYILRMHRIPHAKNSTTIPKDVVFVWHGLLASSADWIIMGPEKGIGYLLADAGYDVWMGNARGNHESRNHTYLDPDWEAPLFWNFSWEEIGYYDLPAMIDYILGITEQPSLFHIGHSQGTTSFYVMASMRPEYNQKIRAHFSLSPIAYQNHMTSPLMHIMAFWEGPSEILLAMMGQWEYAPNDGLFGLVADLICGDDDITQMLCTNAMFMVSGWSPYEMNATMLPVIMGHTPAGAASMQLLHYGQEVNSGRFCRYDYGMAMNLLIYGNILPPEYDLSKITAPMYLFYSHNDWLAAEIDVLRLANELPNVQAKVIVGDGLFNHLDYMYGIDAPKYVYYPVIGLMSNH